MKLPIFISYVIVCVTTLSLLSIGDGRCQSARGDSSLASTRTLAGKPASNFSLGAGLECGGMNSQGMLGAYIDANIGKSWIDLNLAEVVFLPPASNFQPTLDPNPTFNELSLLYGRQLLEGFDGQARLCFGAGLAYTFGVADGKIIDTTWQNFFDATVHYDSNPFSRLGIVFGGKLDFWLLRHLDLGVRTNLTFAKTETYGLIAIRAGYMFW